MQGVFLVGGLGTRLGVLTHNTPKPLLEVAGKPFLEHLIWNAARFGIKDVILLTGYLHDQFLSFPRRRESSPEIPAFAGMTVKIVCEESPLGTAGALLAAKEHLAENFFLFNGDSIFDFNYLDLPLHHKAVATLSLREVEDAGRYGSVELSGSTITKFSEKNSNGQSGLINAGIYYLSKNILSYIKQTPASLENDVLPKLVSEGKVNGKKYDGYFIDIGLPESLKEAGETLKFERPAAFLDRDGVLNIDHGYTHKVEDFQWVDGAVETVKELNDKGYYVFVVTNQGGIAKGLYTEVDMHNVHRHMQAELMKRGAHIDKFYFCPHHPEGVIPEYTKLCEDRKPNPGMILKGLSEWPVLREKSFLIGDKETDIQAAEKAGIKGIHFNGGSLKTALKF